MELSKKEKGIIQQDIADLNMLAKMYSREKKFEKASNCLKELYQLRSKLKKKRGK